MHILIVAPKKKRRSIERRSYVPSYFAAFAASEFLRIVSNVAFGVIRLPS
jgi:hypothetical protein